MSLSQRYQNRGHFYIILGHCTEAMFCSAYRSYAIELAMYVTDNTVKLVPLFVSTKLLLLHWYAVARITKGKGYFFLFFFKETKTCKLFTLRLISPHIIIINYLFIYEQIAGRSLISLQRKRMPVTEVYGIYLVNVSNTFIFQKVRVNGLLSELSWVSAWRVPALCSSVAESAVTTTFINSDTELKIINRVQY